jgi:hypothetical protein
LSRSRLSLIGVTLLATVFLAACGESAITSDDLSTKVQDGLQPQLTDVGVTLESVDCPEVKAEVGETFTCEGATPEGGGLTIDGEVTEYDSDSGEYNVSFEVVDTTEP